MKKTFKTIQNLSNNPLVGLATAAIKPTPAGVAYAGANLVSKMSTGKTIPEHLKSSIKGPPQSKSNNVGPKKKNPSVAGESVQYDAKQKNILRDRKSRGGLVTYKSVQDLNNKM